MKCPWKARPFLLILMALPRFSKAGISRYCRLSRGQTQGKFHPFAPRQQLQVFLFIFSFFSRNSAAHIYLEKLLLNTNLSHVSSQLDLKSFFSRKITKRDSCLETLPWAVWKKFDKPMPFTQSLSSFCFFHSIHDSIELMYFFKTLLLQGIDDIQQSYL